MAFELPPLPFAKNALEPVMKSETFDYHYDKHHKAYVTKLNQLLEGKPEASKSLVDVIKSSTGGVFNNAAQVWNHTFFWDSLKPGGGGAPPAGDVADLINGLGGWDKFRADFIAQPPAHEIPPRFTAAGLGIRPVPNRELYGRPRGDLLPV